MKPGQIAVLATDLDGTFIPLNGDEQNRLDMRTLANLLAAHRAQLVYVTGRHLESAACAIAEFNLPQPDWMICDVGTSLLKRQPTGGFAPIDQYRQYQADIIRGMPIDWLKEQLAAIEGLRLQEKEKQGRFKLSFYLDVNRLEQLTAQLQRYLNELCAPYSLIQSIDPFTGDGLIDLLPKGISKAYALAWWSQQQGLDTGTILFAGDSGNDFAALTAGYRAIVVGNADRSLAQQVQQVHEQAGWSDRLYLARQAATSGVLEGCRWFGLIG